MPSLLSPQRHRDRPELEVCEAAPRAAAAQDGEPRARAQGERAVEEQSKRAASVHHWLLVSLGCVRLCCHLAQECAQYPHRLHALPPHFRHGRRAALQRQVLLLQRPLQAHPRRMPVSIRTSNYIVLCKAAPTLIHTPSVTHQSAKAKIDSQLGRLPIFCQFLAPMS